jgi:hypothetical protein
MSADNRWLSKERREVLYTRSRREDGRMDSSVGTLFYLHAKVADERIAEALDWLNGLGDPEARIREARVALLGGGDKP